MEVTLCPVEVYAIHESISSELPQIVTDKKTDKQLRWCSGSQEGIRYCLLNGTSGMGVDVFCALPLANGSGGLCLYNSQQKAVAAALGSVSAKKLLEKENISPKCMPQNSCCVRGLFSILATFNQDVEDLPNDSFVMSYRQHGVFHGSLANHPACKTWVDVNLDNVSTLRLLKSVTSIVDKIVEQRRVKKFRDVEDFAAFCKERKLEISDDDRLCVVVFSSNNVNEN